MVTRTLDEVWGAFTDDELRTLLFSLRTTATSLRESAKRDATLRGIYDRHTSNHGRRCSPAYRRGYYERLRCGILEKQRLYEEVHGMIEEISYMLDESYRFDLWPQL